MSSSKKIAEFPDVEAKLQKPSKQSAFERQKAEAEAKRRREEAETAAVYQDFVKSFDHDDSQNNNSGYDSRPSQSRFSAENQQRPPFGGQAYGSGAGKRHFGVPSGAPIKSGPGSLGPPPASFTKKRSYEGFQSSHGAHRSSEETRGRLGFEDRESGALTVSKVFNASDDEEDETRTNHHNSTVPTDRAEEKAISKPTLRLANIPPSTSVAAIRALIPTNLAVENVQIITPSGIGGTERKANTAIVTLSKETPATDIDAAVSSLQNRYLGFGFFLSLHRHLSSAAISSGLTSISSSAAVSHPFGAKRVEESRSNNHPPRHGGYGGRGFAPPTSYDSPAGGGVNRGGLMHVPVRAPRDIKQLRNIHMTIERVLKHGPEFEALLMSRPEVQKDEKWAWIFDSRSEGGVYYRWRLWDIVTGFSSSSASQGASSRARYVPLFENSHAWKAPTQPLAYEYATGVDEFVSDDAYDSSEDEDFEDEQARIAESGGLNDQEDTFLNPIDKAKLAHLLARLPTTLSKIRKGDIARVTAFAITHASRGADEIVDMIVSNIETPFAYTWANPDYKEEIVRGRSANRGEDAAGGSREGSPIDNAKKGDDRASALDLSAPRLLGLYVVSDILSSSSTSGIRHAWRYRQLLETALRNRKTFELLGMMAEKLNWGRLRADKWKRSIGLVLGLWESWCVFPIETHEFFVKSFEKPPELLEIQRAKKEAEEAEKKLAGSKWKTVEGPAATVATGERDGSSGFLPVSLSEGKATTGIRSPVEGEPDLESILETGDTDGELPPNYMYYSSGADELWSDEDLDGEPDADFLELVRAEKQDTTMTEAPPVVKSVAGFQISASKPTAAPRKRMRAVDMFTGSGSEGET